jgi:hypothetical protein
MSALGTTHRLTQPYSHEQNSIIERTNKEIVRHIRALIFDLRQHNHWAMRFCPLVERIHNAQIHSSIGVSPAQLLFGNTIQLDRHLIQSERSWPFKKNLFGSSQMKYLDDLISTQNLLLAKAEQNQHRLDESNRQKRTPVDTSGEPLPITEFPINSFVLLANDRGQKSKFQTNWLGPYRVINSVEGNYVLQDLLTQKEVNARVNQLKAFEYDVTDFEAPWRAATNARGEYYIEKILDHVGDRKHKTQMTFLVKWAGFPDEYNSWEPWGNLRDTEQLEIYLAKHKMRSLLSKQREPDPKRQRTTR